MRMRINLLPTKYNKKRAQNVHELIIMAVILVVTLAGLFGWYKVLDNKLTVAKRNVKEVQAQVEKLKKDIAKVDEFKASTKVLEDKLKVIDELKAKKTGPVLVLDELATAITLTGDVWVRRLVEKDGVMELQMSSLRQDKISDFMLVLESKSKLFQNVRLILTEAQKEKDKGDIYYNFTVSCAVLYGGQQKAEQE